MDGILCTSDSTGQKEKHHFQGPQNNSPSDEENHWIFPHNFTHGEGAKGGSKKRRIFHGSGTQHAKVKSLIISLDVTDLGNPAKSSTKQVEVSKFLVLPINSSPFLEIF